MGDNRIFRRSFLWPTQHRRKSDRPSVSTQPDRYGKEHRSDGQTGPESRLIKEMVRNERAHQVRIPGHLGIRLAP